MSGYTGGHHDQYDNGYGHPANGGDTYYQDDQYYDGGYDTQGTHGANGDGYYDES
jgi:1,3-beta-glucan synthase